MRGSLEYSRSTTQQVGYLCRRPPGQQKCVNLRPTRYFQIPPPRTRIHLSVVFLNVPPHIARADALRPFPVNSFPRVRGDAHDSVCLYDRALPVGRHNPYMPPTDMIPPHAGRQCKLSVTHTVPLNRLIASSASSRRPRITLSSGSLR